MSYSKSLTSTLSKASPMVGSFGSVASGSGGPFGGSTSWMPTSGHGAGPQSYDLSGLRTGATMMQQSPWGSTTQKFKVPSLSRLPESDYMGVYDSAMRAASAPIRSQANERMRMMSQGFGNVGYSPHMQELHLKNAMKTGEDIESVASALGSSMATGRLEDARGVRDKLFDTRVEGQKFDRDTMQSRADDQFRRADAMMQYGLALPQFQVGAYSASQEQFNQLLAMLGVMSGFGKK